MRRSGRPISRRTALARATMRLYDLIFKRALASQMASARLERTTVELTDGTASTGLRATGQVVLFPGFLALYEEGRDDAEDEDSRPPAAPARGRYAGQEGRRGRAAFHPAAAALFRGEPGQADGGTRDRAPVDLCLDAADAEGPRLCPAEKNRFIPEESGRLLTAFLERFFERYVSYDFTAHLEDELDDVSGGRAGWQAVLEAFWKDFKPKTGEVMEQKPSEVTAALDEFLAPWLFPDKADGSDPRICARLCGTGRLALRGGKFGAFVACSNYPECKFTRRFGAGERGRRIHGPQVLGRLIPESGLEVTPALRALRALFPARRGQGRQARLAPQGCAGGRMAISRWRCAAVAAAPGRRPSRERQADHREHRPLWPYTRP